MKTSVETIRQQATNFVKTTDIKQLGKLLHIDKNQIILHSIAPHYYEFKIPKHNGKFRLIEDPNDTLKEILQNFNHYLQAVYFIHQTEAAYGFIINPKGNKKPKNILQNARQHLGNDYMLKIDLKDFFHQIKKKQIYQILQQKPFQFSSKTAQILSKIFIYKGRLPMGAPTSPVLSNFASINLDKALQSWANTNKITYTRFADDMTFSSNEIKFTKQYLQQIVQICHQNHYELNTKKTKFYDANDIKKVTGLILNNTVDIAPMFYTELNGDIKRLKHTIEASIIVREHMQNNIVKKMKQEVQGKINFIGMIEGYNSQLFWQYNKKYKQALRPNNEQLFIRWTHSNYI